MPGDDPKVWLYDDQGRPELIYKSQLQDALGQGWSLPESEEQFRSDLAAIELEEQQSDLPGQIAGFAEGALGTATFGGTDRIRAEQMTPDQLAQMEARRETTGGQAGQAVGYIAPAVVPGGAALPAGAAARGAAALGRAAAKPLAGAAERSIVGKVAQKGLQLGVEGALGAGYTQVVDNVTDATLGDEELTSERVLMDVPESMGYGLAFGGILGVGGSAVAQGARTAARAPGKLLGGRRALDAVEDTTGGLVDTDVIISDELEGIFQAGNALRKAKRAVGEAKKAGSGAKPGLAKAASKLSPALHKAIDGYVDGVGAARGVAAAERQVLKDTLKSPSARKDFLARNELKKELSKNAAPKVKKALRAIDEVEKLAPKFDDVVRNVQRTDEAVVQAKAAATRIQANADTIAATSDDVSRKQAEALRGPAKRLQDAAESGDGPQLYKTSHEVARTYRALADEGNELAARYADELDNYVTDSANWGAAAQQGKAASTAAMRSAEVRRVLSELDNSEKLNGYFSSLRQSDDSVTSVIQRQVDALDEMIESGGLTAKQVTAANKARGRLLEASGELSVAAERITPTNVLDDLARQEKEGFFGQYPMAAALGTGLMFGPGAYVGARMANTLAKPATLTTQVGMVEALAHRAGQIDSGMTRAVKTALGTLGKTAKKAKKRPKPVVAASMGLFSPDPKKKEKSYSKVRRNLEELAQNPTRTAETIKHITAGIEGISPSLSVAVGVKHAQTIRYLADQLPKPPSHLRTKRERDQWTPRPDEITAFARKYRAVTDPHSVIQDLKTGDLTLEAVGALRDVRPRLYEQVRQRVITEIYESQQTPNYGSVVQLSILFDFEGDSSMNPQSIVAQQQMWAEVEAEEQQTPQPTGEAPQVAEQSMSWTQNALAQL